MEHTTRRYPSKGRCYKTTYAKHQLVWARYKGVTHLFARLRFNQIQRYTLPPLHHAKRKYQAGRLHLDKLPSNTKVTLYWLYHKATTARHVLCIMVQEHRFKYVRMWRTLEHFAIFLKQQQKVMQGDLHTIKLAQLSETLKAMTGRVHRWFQPVEHLTTMVTLLQLGEIPSLTPHKPVILKSVMLLMRYLYTLWFST